MTGQGGWQVGPPAGEPAPSFDLRTAGSGWRIGPQDAVGRRLVLVFHLQSTASTALEVNRAVRDRYPSPEEVLIASVIDLSFVPPAYQMSVEPILNAAYQEATAELPPGAEPTEYVLILPDWDGSVSRDYGARGTGRAAVIVVVDEGSNVVGSYQGERPVEAVLELLARPEPSD